MWFQLIVRRSRKNSASLKILIRAKMSNFACKINSRVIAYTNIKCLWKIAETVDGLLGNLNASEQVLNLTTFFNVFKKF